MNSVFDELETQIEGADPATQQNQPGNEQGQQPVVQPAVAPVLDSQSVAAIVASTLQAQQQAAPPKEMTEAEKIAHYKVWQPDEQYANNYATAFGPDGTTEQRLAAFHAMREGMQEQFGRTLELALEEVRGQFNQQFMPAVQIAQEQQAQALQTQFNTTYPSLKGQETLVNMVADSLTKQYATSGQRPANVQEFFKQVAQATEGVIKRSNPNFVLTTNNGSQPQAAPGMASVAMGGGSPSAPAQQRAKNPYYAGDELFGS